MKDILSQVWFWFIMLILFLAVIMYDRDFEKEVLTAYQKQKMHLKDVHFSEMDDAFEAARIFADEVDMDDAQNNMLATNVRSLFFDKQVATRSGELIASYASKNPQEIIFWGDVRFWDTDKERLRTEELRYASNRKELYSIRPVTIWKDNMVITGKELLYNTNTKEGSLNQNVVIRIWPNANSASSSSKIASGSFKKSERPGISPIPSSMSGSVVTELGEMVPAGEEKPATGSMQVNDETIPDVVLEETPAASPDTDIDRVASTAIIATSTSGSPKPPEPLNANKPPGIASSVADVEKKPDVASETMYENKVDSRFQRDIIIIPEKNRNASPPEVVKEDTEKKRRSN